MPITSSTKTIAIPTMMIIATISIASIMTIVGSEMRVKV